MNTPVKTNGDAYVQAYDFDCDDGGLDPILVLGTAVITAAATFQLYTQVTSGGKKRRKRRAGGGGEAVQEAGVGGSGFFARQNLPFGKLVQGIIASVTYLHICVFFVSGA